MPNSISKANLKKIAEKIKEDIYKPAFNFRTTIFLCGANIRDKNTIRFKLACEFQKSFWFDLIYPEDIFDEILFSSKTKDLLSLEGLLADSVDAVIIIPESAGSFAELGAFANDEKLRKKLICVVDKKYIKDKSFISQGPLKLIKNSNNFALIYIDPNKIDQAIIKVSSAIKKMRKISIKDDSKISLLQLEYFLLPSIYLMEPVSKDILISLTATALEDENISFDVTTTVLTILTKKKLIQLSPDGYKLTLLGLQNFFAFQKTGGRIKWQIEKIVMDNIRLEILNLKNRNKKMKV